LRKFDLILKLKRRELKEEELKLRTMLHDLQIVESEIKLRKRRVQELNSSSFSRIADYAFVLNYSFFLLKEIEELEVKKENLERNLKVQKEKLSYKRGEVKILENFMKKKRLEKEKRDDVLLERFINEVRSGYRVG
jgi:hypothetical protein